MLALLSLLACADDTDATAAPTLAFVAPPDGAVVTADTAVAVSLLVEDFGLESPAKHNEGMPEGYVVLRVDGVDAETMATTQTEVLLAAGAHTLEAELFYVDGDALQPAVVASVGVTAE